jgi:hypothetical protein
MKTQSFFTCLLLSLFLILNAVQIHAQFIIKEKALEIPVDYSLFPEDVEFDSMEDEMEYILNIPLDDLIAAAKNEGYDIAEETTVSYFDGDRFAVETSSEESGKMTMLSDVATGKMLLIIWAQRMIMEVAAEDVENVQEQTNQDIEEMIKDMPPEAQDAIRAEMQQDFGSSDMPVQTSPTGKTQTINNFVCEEYRVQAGEEMKSIWFTRDTQGLLKALDVLSQKYQDVFKMDEEDDFDAWKLIPGNIPIQVKSVSMDYRMGEPTLSVETVTQILKETPPAGVFEITGEAKDFERVSYEDARQNRMDMR